MNKKFLIITKTEIVPIEEENILFLQASGSYTLIYTAGKTFKVSQNMKHTLERITRKHLFIKIHRSYIINKNKIITINKAEGIYWNLQLEDTEQKIPISTRYLRELKNSMHLL